MTDIAVTMDTLGRLHPHEIPEFPDWFIWHDMMGQYSYMQGSTCPVISVSGPRYLTRLGSSLYLLRTSSISGFVSLDRHTPTDDTAILTDRTFVFETLSRLAEKNDPTVIMRIHDHLISFMAERVL